MLANDGVCYSLFKYGDSERVKDGRFFSDMNEERWEAIKQEITYRVEEKNWLTIDQRADSSEAWFNMMIKKV